jgi:CTP synthase (UTP-ammonia lyase)
MSMMPDFDLIHLDYAASFACMQTIPIGILGDFNPNHPLHLATNQALQHAARALGRSIVPEWLATDQTHEYEKYEALWCSPGSPYRSLEGALEGIRHAREKQVPFLGTCGGFQHAVVEYGRNVMGLTEATHAEYDIASPIVLVTPLSCSLVGQTMQVDLVPGSRAQACYGQERAEESYYCSFGLNPAYREDLQAAGLRISGWDSDREPRIVEVPAHPFFLATLFVPQAKSNWESPHPVVIGFCQAALDRVHASRG